MPTTELKTWSAKGRATMNKKKNSFSKVLLVQESVLIWLLTISFIVLAFLCVICDYTGSLPWLAVTLTGAWTAYGVSQAMYYRKSEKENTAGGIVFETAMNPAVTNRDC